MRKVLYYIVIMLNGLRESLRRILVKPKTFVPTHRHVKTGGLYRILHTGAILEATLEPCVIYEGMHGDIIWIRPESEFFDGRFVELRGSQKNG